MKHAITLAALVAATLGAQASVISTQDAAAVSAFQHGLTVETFENVPGRTPMTITNYLPGNAVDADARVYDQIAGVRWSVGGQVGVNTPALFYLDDGASGGAHSGHVVLGPVSFDDSTEFDHIIELYFPTKVAKVGFWLDPTLSDVQVLALDNNFAFTHDPDENILESTVAKAGYFTGFEHATADIASLKFQVRAGSKGMTMDDFSYGGSVSAVPEPGSLALLLPGTAALLISRRRKAMRR